ncbi:MAG: undecaprenyl-diphosphate phosphatase [Planctomycetes bacterium]|jgi:undecaprenyl-diphosphatase|nr:undecaprenyl-diphosphate phosphatase [Planctomycetota bacterium]
MTWWQALILGIVEGLTEYLPVSSTGHLIITAWLLGLDADPQIKEAVDSFNIVIQAGAIAAVAGLYWSRVKQMGKGLIGRDADGRRLLTNLVVAFLPAAAMGPFLNDPIKAHLFAPWPVIGALFVGAWLMLAVAWNQKLIERNATRDLDHVDWKIALLIGFGQCIAMWPGTSRSMMTIVAALLLGMRARAAAEFSFLLGLITLGAATCYDAYHGGEAIIQHIGITPLIVGFIAATISAALAVKWFVGFLTRHGLALFGWYRLGLALLLALLIVTGLMSGFGPEPAAETPAADTPAASAPATAVTD